MDLISRQAAIDAFLKELTKRERKNLLHTWSTVEVKYFITELLEKLPSVQERKGQWLRYGEDGYPNEKDTVAWQCDQCLTTYYGRTERIANYCPNCGAHMEGAEDEQTG